MFPQFEVQQGFCYALAKQCTGLSANSPVLYDIGDERSG